MARRSRQVDQALNRWEEKGLLAPDLAASLRREAEQAHSEATSRWGQILVAALGAVALVLAAVLFAQNNWERLSDSGRIVTLMGMGLGVYVAGLVVYRRVAWHYSGILLQAGGMAVILSALLYSAEVWDAGSGQGWLMGILGLLVAAVTAPASYRQGPLMTGVHGALSYGFVIAFLHLALAMDMEAVVWVLDGLTILLIAGVFRHLAGSARGSVDHALTLLGVALWAGLILALFTGLGPLDMDENSALAMDAWLVVIVAITLWGLHSSPESLRRVGYEINLALCVGVGANLMLWTGAEPLDGGIELGAALAAVVGLAGMTYGVTQRSSYVLVVGALAALEASWIFALDQAGAMGGVVALAVSAGVLFWVSTRIRAQGHGRQESQDDLPLSR